MSSPNLQGDGKGQTQLLTQLPHPLLFLIHPMPSGLPVRADRKADAYKRFKRVRYLCIWGKVTSSEIAFHDFPMDFFQGQTRKVNIYW